MGFEAIFLYTAFPTPESGIWNSKIRATMSKSDVELVGNLEQPPANTHTGINDTVDRIARLRVKITIPPIFLARLS